MILRYFFSKGASNGQDITNRFLDVIKDPQTEIQLKTLYCTKFKIQNCESSFNQIKQELLDSFKNNSQKCNQKFTLFIDI